MDLEFQELKGFMELGFDFSHGNMSPRVLDLLPELKCLSTDHVNGTKIFKFGEGFVGPRT